MKPVHTTIVLVALSALVAGCGIGEQERKYRDFYYQTAQALAPGFRLPDGALYGPAWAVVEGRGWQTRDGSGRTKAEFWTSGEFNGDGELDYSYILVEDATDGLVLLAFMSTPEGYDVYRLDEGFEWGIWLRTLPRSQVQLPAREAISDPSTGAAEIDSRLQSIEFFQFEGSATRFVWNSTTQSFDRTSASD